MLKSSEASVHRRTTVGYTRMRDVVRKTKLTGGANVDTDVTKHNAVGGTHEVWHDVPCE